MVAKPLTGFWQVLMPSYQSAMCHQYDNDKTGFRVGDQTDNSTLSEKKVWANQIKIRLKDLLYKTILKTKDLFNNEGPKILFH